MCIRDRTKGARVVQLLQRWVEDTEQAHDYLLTKTPLMAKRELYKISGHWDHYLDGMFTVSYTHLDVYKRQASLSARTTSPSRSTSIRTPPATR